MRVTLSFFALLTLTVPAPAEQQLPLRTTFQGSAKFKSITTRARQMKWNRLPIGDRMAAIAQELEGTPYKGFTLEIHDEIESPSVNFNGQDCWTFFESVLGLARMLETTKKIYRPGDLLTEIEQTRYRGGVCRGNYLDRIHYLAEWYIDNARRGNITDLTRTFPSVRMPPQCGEMSRLWKHYRYLAHNPALRVGMAKHEDRLNKTPVYMVPKARVAAIEKKLQNGDIIGIARQDHGSYCSHVGLIVLDGTGKRRFMHASTTYRKVVLDDTISNYLHKFRKHAGILVARPSQAP